MALFFPGLIIRMKNMVDGRVIFINVNVSTDDDAVAARAIDILSRMILGLALEGLETSLEVTTGFILEELEIEEDSE